MDDPRNKWAFITTAVWILALISVAAAAWLAYNHGVVTIPGASTLAATESQTHVNIPILIACAVQALSSILFALIVNMLHDTYQTTADIWQQNQDALRYRK